MASLLHGIRHHWIISYDDVPEIRRLYEGFRHVSYDLHYSAQDRYQGSEVMFLSANLNVPDVDDPARISDRALKKHLL